MIEQAPALGLAAVAGLALGSYAVTAGVRFARDEASTRGRSHCDHCGLTLSPSQTIPVISYILARGCCGACQARIDPIHIVGELSGMLVVLTAFLVPDLFRAPLLVILGLLLVAASTVDWKIGRLPDVVTGAIAIVAILLAAFKSRDAVVAGLVASALAFLVLMGFRWVRANRGKDPGLGLGDVKLICALALWLGTTTPWMVVAANLIGLVIVKTMRPSVERLALGPALAAAAWVVGIGGELGSWPTTA